jgi:hypothetical protein
MCIAMCNGLLTALCWVGISRSVQPTKIPLYGLAYDAMLTLIFLLTPFCFISFNLSGKQIVGIVFILTGLFLTK